MANTLARIQRDGLIDRVPDPADGRRALVTLTSRARDLQDQLIAARAVNATATRGLDEPQTTAFLAALAARSTTSTLPTTIHRRSHDQHDDRHRDRPRHPD